MSNTRITQTVPKSDAEEKRFRIAWVIEPSHDMSPLLKYTDRIEFLCSGYEKTEELFLIIADKLGKFDRDHDVLVPTGRVVASLITGIILSQIESPVTLGIFRDKDYNFLSFNYAALGQD